jgi:hypothetical protein
MSEPYLLSPHVHVCVAGKHVVLLDLEQDKYLAVVPAHRLARWVRGWPAVEPSDPVSLPPGEIRELSGDQGRRDDLLSKMIAQGMLITDPQRGKEAIPVVTKRPDAALIEFDLDTRPSFTWVHAWHFLIAYTAAKAALKLRPIKSVVQAASGRKARAMQREGENRKMATGRPAFASQMDLGTVRHLVTAFVRLRPLFFTVHGACLLDSLALLNFLARYRVFPEWVFGVKTDPFLAHCWIQHGDVVFNDFPDYVRGFTPILVI